jgi:hypothetical protein
VYDIPLGTAFSVSLHRERARTCTALPPWPGDDEAVIVDARDDVPVPALHR